MPARAVYIAALQALKDTVGQREAAGVCVELDGRAVDVSPVVDCYVVAEAALLQHAVRQLRRGGAQVVFAHACGVHQGAELGRGHAAAAHGEFALVVRHADAEAADLRVYEGHLPAVRHAVGRVFIIVRLADGAALDDAGAARRRGQPLGIEPRAAAEIRLIHLQRTAHGYERAAVVLSRYGAALPGAVAKVQGRLGLNRYQVVVEGRALPAEGLAVQAEGDVSLYRHALERPVGIEVIAAAIQRERRAAQR